MGGDRFSRNHLNHLRDNPEGLEREVRRAMTRANIARDAWRERQRELERAAYIAAGFEPGGLDAIYAEEDRRREEEGAVPSIGGARSNAGDEESQ